MSQNIYDNLAFFVGYKTFPRLVNGLDSAPEWPRLRSSFPDLTGARVLDLGCGFGWFSLWARTAGAAFIHGIDLSQNMLDRDPSTTDDSSITYHSLLLQYLTNLRELVKEVHRALKPGGIFVFYIAHPLYTAPSRAEVMRDKRSGQQYWPLSGYQSEAVRAIAWLADGVQKQHRTLTTHINTSLDEGFDLRGFHEWYSTQAELKRDGLREVMDMPVFLLMSVAKK